MPILLLPGCGGGSGLEDVKKETDSRFRVIVKINAGDPVANLQALYTVPAATKGQCADTSDPNVPRCDWYTVVIEDRPDLNQYVQVCVKQGAIIDGREVVAAKKNENDLWIAVKTLSGRPSGGFTSIGNPFWAVVHDGKMGTAWDEYGHELAQPNAEAAVRGVGSAILK